MPHRQSEDLSARLSALLSGTLEANVLRDELRMWRPEDIAEALHGFSTPEKIQLFTALETDEARAIVLSETDSGSRVELVEVLPWKNIGGVVDQMDPDDAADLVEELEAQERVILLDSVEPETARGVEELMRYPADSAGGIMTSEFVAAGANDTARDILLLLQKSIDTEVQSYVYVVEDDDRLIGVVSIREIIAAEPEDVAHALMKKEVISAEVTLDQEEVAHMARKYNLDSIPIVDSAGALLGVVTIDDIVDIISDEADEDIYRLAGSPGQHPAQQTTFRRIVARIPWLFISLAAGLTVAYIQKEEVQADVGTTPIELLVVFTPLVIGIAGGVGTQSSTLIARGLATGEIEMSRTKRILTQELAIGCAIGVVFGVVVFGLLSAMTTFGYFPDVPNLALGISAGLTSGVLLAALSGTSIPLVCQAARVDPALVAGPFITGFNDVVGAFAYLAIAKVIV